MRRLLLLALLASLPMAVRAADPIRVLLVDGYGNHDWQLTTKLIRGVLAQAGGFTVDVSTAPTNRDELAAWSPSFAGHDVVMQTVNDLGGGPKWPAGVRSNLEAYVRGGGGLFVFHSANNAFADWPAYCEMIGLGWRKPDQGYALRVRADDTIERIPPGQGHGTSHGARIDGLVTRLGDHPIHAGLPRQWRTTELEVYTYARGPATNLTVLSCAADAKTGERWPVEWVVQFGAGRVYNSTFGHVWRGDVQPAGMRCAGVQTILVRALAWLAQRPVPETVPADFPATDKPSLRAPIAL